MNRKPGRKWNAIRRGALLTLRTKHARLLSWYDFWSTPFYRRLRRHVLRKEDAYSVYVTERDRLLARLDRIARRYGQ